MKVIHITETLKGGIETYLKNLTRHQQGAPEISNLRFVLPEKVDWLPSDVVHNVPAGRSIRMMVSYAMSVSEIIRRERPEIVHAHSSIAGALVRLCAIFNWIPKEVKIVYCSHGWAFDQRISPLKKALYIAIERVLSLKTDATVCISPHEKRVAEQAGIRGCICIANGIDPVASRVRAHAPKMGQKRIVLFVGRLDRQKGIDLLLESYARVQPKFNLIVAGAAIRDDVILHRSSSVKFKDWVTSDELDDLYQNCDVLIVPSRWEGFGLVAIEAMARGKPVFASNVGGLADIVLHNETGRLFELENIDTVLRDLDDITDQALQEMGDHGRRAFNGRFTAHRMNAEIIDVYSSVLAQ